MDVSRKSGGNFRERKRQNLMGMTTSDFNNPWNFFSLMMLSDDEVYQWFRMHGLLATTISCNSDGCEGRMVLKSSSRRWVVQYLDAWRIAYTLGLVRPTPFSKKSI